MVDMSAFLSVLITGLRDNYDNYFGSYSPSRPSKILFSKGFDLVHQEVLHYKKLYLILKNIIANGCSYGTKGGVIDISITKSKYVLTLQNMEISLFQNS